jgi:hypothetical protein
LGNNDKRPSQEKSVPLAPHVSVQATPNLEKNALSWQITCSEKGKDKMKWHETLQ